MIEFTTTNGRRVAINPMTVFMIEPGMDDQGSIISSAGGPIVMVIESFDDVHERIKVWMSEA